MASKIPGIPEWKKYFYLNSHVKNTTFSISAERGKQLEEVVTKALGKIKLLGEAPPDVAAYFRATFEPKAIKGWQKIFHSAEKIESYNLRVRDFWIDLKNQGIRANIYASFIVAIRPEISDAEVMKFYRGCEYLTDAACFYLRAPGQDAPSEDNTGLEVEFVGPIYPPFKFVGHIDAPENRAGDVSVRDINND